MVGLRSQSATCFSPTNNTQATTPLFHTLTSFIMPAICTTHISARGSVPDHIHQKTFLAVQTGFITSYNNMGFPCSRLGGAPYPWAQTTWTRCDSSSPTHNFEELHFKDYELAIKRVTHLKLEKIIWSKWYGRDLLLRGLQPLTNQDYPNFGFCLTYTAAVGPWWWMRWHR